MISNCATHAYDAAKMPAYFYDT